MSRRDRRPPPPQLHQQTHLTSIQKVEAFSGPLPPPALLEHYEQVLPGSAERIVAMAEGESTHRRSCEQKALEADVALNNRDYDERRRGQVLAFIIVFLSGVAGAYFILHGKELAGTVFGGPAIAAIIGAFLHKPNKEKKSSKD